MIGCFTETITCVMAKPLVLIKPLLVILPILNKSETGDWLCVHCTQYLKMAVFTDIHLKALM